MAHLVLLAALPNGLTRKKGRRCGRSLEAACGNAAYIGQPAAGPRR